MNINLKIHRAILKGLNEALANLSVDDFDNIEVPDQNYNEDILIHSGHDEYEKWKWVKDNFVDLGLPSETLWCKWNIGATCDDIPESWYGHYYMWGSTTPNENGECCWSTAPFNNGSTLCDMEYFVEHLHEFVGRSAVLFNEFDAAYQIDNRMHIPTRDLIIELGTLPNEWITNYSGVNGLNGREFFGKNGNSIFIPASGYLDSTCVSFAGKRGNLWSNVIWDGLDFRSASSGASDICFTAYLVFSKHYNLRYRGLPIRGVIDKNNKNI